MIIKITSNTVSLFFVVVALMNSPAMAAGNPQSEVAPQSEGEVLDESFYQAKPKIQLYSAYAEFKMGNYSAARTMWEAINGQGHSEAAFNLGILYEQGLGVEADPAKATHHYLNAARLGSRAAAYQIGLMHDRQPELVSAREAALWLTAAAMDGDRDAADELSQFSAEDASPALTAVWQLLKRGDLQQALAKLQSASTTDSVAASQLAWLYQTGLGVNVDTKLAQITFLEAAQQGDAVAQHALGILFSNDDTRLTSATEPRQWLESAAGQGYPPAIRDLATHQ